MSSTTPTREDIQRLISFLPRLYAEEFKPIEQWNGLTVDESGNRSFPWPTYHPLVNEFFAAAGAACWMDRSYDVSESADMLRDEQRVKTADIAQIRKMLTYCVRSERFGDGAWGGLISDGLIRRLLERLAVLANAEITSPNKNG